MALRWEEGSGWRAPARRTVSVGQSQSQLPGRCDWGDRPLLAEGPKHRSHGDSARIPPVGAGAVAESGLTRGGGRGAAGNTRDSSTVAGPRAIVLLAGLR